MNERPDSSELTETERPAAEPSSNRPNFRSDIAEVINRHSLENISNTPDFILAQLLCDHLFAFDVATRRREKWYGRNPDRGPGETSSAELASLAGEVLGDPNATAREKRLAGSVLTQAQSAPEEAGGEVADPPVLPEVAAIAVKRTGDKVVSIHVDDAKEMFRAGVGRDAFMAKLEACFGTAEIELDQGDNTELFVDIVVKREEFDALEDFG